MAFVSVTRLRLRFWWYLPLFFRHALPSFQQSANAFGNLSTQVDRRGTVFWTLTVWLDEAAMRSYMTSGAHRKAMPKLVEWCDEASTVHWHQDAPTCTWQEAKQRMLGQGRLYPLKRPSKAHAAGLIPQI